jgi:hypothetical protein
VSDGKFTPVFRHFNIHIIPLELNLLNHTAIEIQQGLKMAHVSSKNLGMLKIEYLGQNNFGNLIPFLRNNKKKMILIFFSGVRTNGQRSLTFYNITSSPSGGLIYMNDAPASVFGQVNVDNEEVITIFKN